MSVQTAPAVRTMGLTKAYGQRRSVDGLTIDLPQGVVTGFVGPNGAGKTTTLRMLLGLIRPTSGSAEVLGHPIDRPQDYLHDVGAMIEGPAFHPSVTGRRNLLALAQAGRHPLSRIAPALDRVGLSDRADDRVKDYSLGMRQRLGIAAALLSDPLLLLLDEPTNGLDPEGIREVRALLRDLADEGRSVLVSSHLLSELEEVSDHVVVIREGRLIYAGPVEGMLDGASEEVRIVPERSADVLVLQAILRGEGFSAMVAAGALQSDVDPVWVNRTAHGAGIVLRELTPMRRSLEDAFFEMTAS